MNLKALKILIIIRRNFNVVLFIKLYIFKATADGEIFLVKKLKNNYVYKQVMKKSKN